MTSQTDIKIRNIAKMVNYESEFRPIKPNSYDETKTILAISWTSASNAER